jgi:hypothetical protein
MRKRVCCALLLLSFLLVSAAPAWAQVVDWRLIWQDDGSILETVKLEKVNLPLEVLEEDWQSSTDSQNKLVLTRRTADWDDYQQRSDRLPLSVVSRNFLVLKVATINSANFPTAPEGLYAQISTLPDAQLSIKLPGIIRDHSADRIVESQEAVWQLNRLDHIVTEDQLLKATVFDGLLLAIMLVGLAIIIIGLFFMRSINRVHKLIETEYSLENIELEEPDNSTTGTEEQ